MEFDYSNLRQLMARNKVRVGQLATLCGMSVPHLSTKLNGHYFFTQQQIVDICNALGISRQNIPKYFFKLRFEKTER